MNTLRGRIRDFARRQHGVVARWQLGGLCKNEIDVALRGLRRIQGVWAIGDLTELGWFMAAGRGRR